VGPRSKGFRPDSREGIVDPSASVRYGAPSVPPSFRLADRLPGKRDLDRTYQGSAPSCLAHALDRAIRSKNAMSGEASPPGIARRHLWWLGRVENHDQDRYVGMYGRPLLAAVQRDGFCLEQFCPYSDDVKDAFAPPSPLAFMHANDQRGLLEYHRCDTVLEVQRAAVAGAAIICCFEADDAFDFYAGGVWHQQGDGSGHAVSLEGWEWIDGELAFRCANWWSDWGENGYGWMAASSVGLAYELWAIDVAPRPSEMP